MRSSVRVTPAIFSHMRTAGFEMGKSSGERLAAVPDKKCVELPALPALPVLNLSLGALVFKMDSSDVALQKYAINLD